MKLPENLRRHYASVRGRRIAYVASVSPKKSQPPLVLVHGVGLSYRYLAAMASAIADRLPVYVPDLPGFGRSYKPWRTQSLAELADWLADYMRALQLHDPGVFGQSLGCQIVVHLAYRHPELVQGAILQGMTVDPEARTLAQQFVRWRRNQHVEKSSKENSPSALPDYWRCGLRRIFSTYRDAIRDRPESMLPHVNCPTLVVRGERDPIVSHNWAARVAELLPSGRLITMQNVSHTINSEAPEDLVAVIEPFLNEMVPQNASIRLGDSLTAGEATLRKSLTEDC